MRYEDMLALADQAAELLPEPPDPGDRDGYLGWTALTVDTGRQLARVLGADPELLRSLIDDDQRTLVDYRQRRHLLLSVALYAARQLAGVAASKTAGRTRAVIVGDVVSATTANPLSSGLRLR